jgi:hypothetical protein
MGLVNEQYQEGVVKLRLEQPVCRACGNRFNTMKFLMNRTHCKQLGYVRCVCNDINLHYHIMAAYADQCVAEEVAL